jgi:hypothetical protein
MLRTILKAASAIALISAMATAHTAPITVKFDGYVSGSKNGRIYGPEQNKSRAVAAGQFRFDVIADPQNAYWDDELHAFCIDVTQWLVTGQQVQYELTRMEDSSYLNTSQRARISWLFDHAASTLGSAANDASFQLALWEQMYDSSPLSLLDGANRGSFWSNSFSGSQAPAESWLTGLANAGITDAYRSTQYELFVLTPLNPVSNQSLIVARPIPEPSVLALIGLGFAGVALVRRRAR